MAKWIKPTEDTKFHIDISWWDNSGQNFRVYLWDQLCSECRERFKTHRETAIVDWVDPETAEVKRTDALWQCLRMECAQQPDFVNEGLPLISAIFRLLLAQDNLPMSPMELNQHIPWKTSEAILKAIGGRRIYLGIRPVPPSS